MTEKEVHIVIPRSMDRSLRSNLSERSSDGKESFAVVLAGNHQSGRRERLLARSLIIPEEDCYRIRSGGLIELLPGFDEHVLKSAEAEKLAVIQIHTHIVDGQPIFSPVDDQSEGARALAVKEALGLDLASIVFDRHARLCQARKWVFRNGDEPQRKDAQVVSESLSLSLEIEELRPDEDFFDRQIRAFGTDFQRAARRVRIGILGLGGMGNAIVSSLSRLGVRDFVLVDHDRIEESNLNRMIGATAKDAEKGRSKVSLGARLVRQVHGKNCQVRAICLEGEDKKARKALSDCDILVAATDNHSSRLYLQKIAAAYHRPLVHAGVGLEGKEGKITQVVGRVASPPVGGDWCLFCGGIIDPELAGKESGDPEHLRMWKEKGYLRGTPDPAVMWVNNIIANKAVAAVHNLIYPFRDSSDGEDVYLDLLNDEVLSIGHSKSGPDCPLCSPEGLMGLGDALWTEASPRQRRRSKDEEQMVTSLEEEVLR